MSTEYSDRKTREILAKVNGQGKLAEQAVIALTQRDPQFLQSLVAPYLNGIILHAIERVRKQSGSKDAPAVKIPAPVARQPIPKKAVPAKPISSNGMDNMMQALAASFEKNSIANAAPPADAGKVSQSHVEAMRALITRKT
ncbi:MAG: hypothetical protein JWM96_794 [Alphaproteobacteria bacterium]|nr:hypothetical protein [Alphaproteobacteria bacterium]